MEQKQLFNLIDYLFEKGYLNFNEIIEKYVDSEKNYTTYSLLNKVIEDYINTK
jgi:hypothetical protein